jgi:hypothetical protein
LEKRIEERRRRSFGDWSVEGTPGPIPNPAVKLNSADGTWGATPWESRSLPKDLFLFEIDSFVRRQMLDALPCRWRSQCLAFCFGFGVGKVCLLVDNLDYGLLDTAA